VPRGQRDGSLRLYYQFSRPDALSFLVSIILLERIIRILSSPNILLKLTF
jgi:hypothetical protein